MDNRKVKEAYDNLIRGIERLKDSEQWKQYLDIQSRFHNYSFGNTILIMIQYPNATRVAGIKTWNSLGRWVKKGEKGIQILAPIIKTKIETTEKGEEKEISYLAGFRPVYVFDISQTEGKELPEITRDLKGNSQLEIYNKLKSIINIPIIEKELETSLKGYYDQANNMIVLNSKADINQKVKTLLHEYAHSILHKDPIEYQQERARCETEAESIAYIVANYFNFDTSQYSFGYITAWAGAKTEVVKKSLDTIQKTAQNIIEQVERVNVQKIA